jgi:hypothetical protein
MLLLQLEAEGGGGELDRHTQREKERERESGDRLLPRNGVEILDTQIRPKFPAICSLLVACNRNGEKAPETSSQIPTPLLFLCTCTSPEINTCVKRTQKEPV